MNYIGIVNTPRLSSEHIAKVLVPSGGLYAGQVVYCENLSSSIDKNYEIYSATKPTSANFDSKNLAIVLNGGFETLADGRRPDGQPDFTQYTFEAGETATVVFIDRHIKYSIGYDSIDTNTVSTIAIGKYLIPLNNSNNLAVATSVPTTTACALKVVGIRSMALGGNLAGEYATTYICISQNDDIVDTGNYITSFSLPNQVGTSVINQSNGTITAIVAGSRTGIAATFTNSIDAVVKVGGVTQVSGVTTNTFTGDVTYIVTSESGASKTYIVTISLEEYSLTTTPDSHATITVTRGGTPITSADTIFWGDILTISASYDTGYEKDLLTVNGEAFISGDTHTVIEDVEIIATSSLIEYTLTISDTETITTVTRDGTEIISGAIIYYGDELVISAVPIESATGVGIHVNDIPFNSGETYNVIGDTNVVTISS